MLKYRENQIYKSPLPILSVVIVYIFLIGFLFSFMNLPSSWANFNKKLSQGIRIKHLFNVTNGNLKSERNEDKKAYNFDKLKRTGFINKSLANVREGPSNNYNVVFVIKENEKFNILSEKSNWLKIKYGHKSGYIYKKLVTIN